MFCWSGTSSSCLSNKTVFYVVTYSPQNKAGSDVKKHFDQLIFSVGSSSVSHGWAYNVVFVADGGGLRF